MFGRSRPWLPGLVGLCSALLGRRHGLPRTPLCRSACSAPTGRKVHLCTLRWAFAAASDQYQIYSGHVGGSDAPTADNRAANHTSRISASAQPRQGLRRVTKHHRRI